MVSAVPWTVCTLDVLCMQMILSCYQQLYRVSNKNDPLCCFVKMPITLALLQPNFTHTYIFNMDTHIHILTIFCCLISKYTEYDNIRRRPRGDIWGGTGQTRCWTCVDAMRLSAGMTAKFAVYITDNVLHPTLHIIWYFSLQGLEFYCR